jgi:hypothetical protein
VNSRPPIKWQWIVVAALVGGALGAGFTYLSLIHFAKF